MEAKSPFMVIEEFLSPKMCEEILATINVKEPDVDQDGSPIALERNHADFQTVIYNKFKEQIPSIELKYDAKYRGIVDVVFQFFPENAKKPAQGHGCENSKYVRKKWVKVKDVDLTGIIWLKNYNDSVPLDPRTEVYGGKLEFPLYNFSLVPQQGTLVIFPAGPHFINAISPVLVSDLYQIKLNIAISPSTGGLWFYQPSNFSGTWKDWFKEYF